VGDYSELPCLLILPIRRCFTRQHQMLLYQKPSGFQVA